MKFNSFKDLGQIREHFRKNDSVEDMITLDSEHIRYLKITIEKEIQDIISMSQFFLDQVGGMERYVNRELVPTLFRSVDSVFFGMPYFFDYLIKNNIPTQKQLQLVNALQVAINDILLLATDKNATYDNVQFAYQWAGLARDKWKLPQKTIQLILDTTETIFENESKKQDLPYITSLCIRNKDLFSQKQKIDRFMQNITPNLIDVKNQIYHFNPNSNNSIFLKLDTQEKRDFIEKELAKYKKGWEKMFDEYPTVKMYTHYQIPNSFFDFVMSNEEVVNYFPHNIFDRNDDKNSNENKDVLRFEMKNMLNPIFRKSFFEDTGIDLNQFGKEQAYFTEYISHKKVGEISKFKDFLKLYNSDGIKTFLSLAHGGSDMGQKILDIGEQLPQDVASKIFEKYSAIIDSIDSISDTIQNGFKKSISLQPEELQKLEQSLYVRGVKLLENFHADLKDTNPDEILAELDRINADTIATLSVFKHALRSGNELPLENIVGAEFSKRSGPEVQQSEIDEMVGIYQENWKNFPNQEIIQPVIQKFEKSLAGIDAKNQDIYTFKKDGHINAFVKFEQTTPGTKYASALNVDPNVHGYGLGEAMMDEALYREAQENLLHAMCESDKDSAMRYFEKGFVATGFSPDQPPFLDIWWNESENMHIRSKQMHKDELTLAYLQNKIPDQMEIRKAKTLTELHAQPFPLGTCLTRCFRDPVGTGDWYAVYEVISDTYQTKKPTN